MSNKCGFLDRRETIGRTILAIILLIISSHNLYYLSPMPIYLLWTVIKGRCTIYLALGYNSPNFYLSYLPKLNPGPVLVFNSAGDRVFANTSATKQLPHLNEIRSVFEKEIFWDGDEFINNEITSKQIIISDDKTFLAMLIGVKEISAIVAFIVDISKIEQLNREIIETQKEIVYAMGEIGETRSRETGNHVRRVAEYSRIIAKKLGLPKEKAELLKQASPMHDIGKVGIPDNILKKPGKLTKDEFQIMKTHASIGFNLLNHSKREILKTAAIVACEHHEKWNGKGYPDGKKGEEIHIYGRITAVADVFDALGSDRIYKKAWELEKILDLFKEERGEHFDPTIVDILFDNLDKFLEIRDKYRDV